MCGRPVGLILAMWDSAKAASKSHTLDDGGVRVDGDMRPVTGGTGKWAIQAGLCDRLRPLC